MSGVLHGCLWLLCACTKPIEVQVKQFSRSFLGSFDCRSGEQASTVSMDAMHRHSQGATVIPIRNWCINLSLPTQLDLPKNYPPCLARWRGSTACVSCCHRFVLLKAAMNSMQLYCKQAALWTHVKKELHRRQCPRIQKVPQAERRVAQKSNKCIFSFGATSNSTKK